MILSKKAFAVGAAVLLGFNLLAAGDSSAPQFQELYNLLRTNMAGANDADLNRAAVHGLINQLSPKVSIVEDENSAGAGYEPSGAVPFKTSVFENSFGYLRLGQFGAGADKKLLDAYRGMASTNRIKGLILDLRYSEGDDYAGAAALADRFFSKDEPLLDWGQGMRKSSVKTNALDLPIALLVNRKTSGAAEAFAAMLRQGQIGLLIGTNTAGNAAIAKEFVLSTGQRVRVASTPVKLGNDKAFPAGGLQPDIFVSVSPDDELAWFDDAYKVMAKSTARVNIGSSTNDVASLSTNRSHRRLNEAELVRMLKEGLNPENELGSGAREIERARGILGDPVLARALDLLKGLTVVQQFRSS
jgi:hypothetical protein